MRRRISRLVSGRGRHYSAVLSVKVKLELTASEDNERSRRGREAMARRDGSEASPPLMLAKQQDTRKESALILPSSLDKKDRRRRGRKGTRRTHHLSLRRRDPQASQRRPLAALERSSASRCTERSERLMVELLLSKLLGLSRVGRVGSHLLRGRDREGEGGG